MNKHILAILLVLAMIITLCACTKTVQPDSSTPPVPETPEEPAPEPAEAEIVDDGLTPVKVGFIYLHDEQSTYDLNFMRAAKEACEELNIPYLNKVDIPEGGECYEAAMDLVDEGCNIVFADSFGHEDYLIQAAQTTPNVQFCHATGTQAHTVGLPNFHNAFASIYEGRFMAGVAAGMKMNEMMSNGEFTPEEAKIGYIGAYPYAEVKSGYTAFFLGARYICPDVTMEVVFTNSWYNEALEKEGANRLIQNGCKLISQHADSMGAPSACENMGIPNVSYNGSTIAVAPNTFIVSTLIDWAPYFKYIIECVQTNKPIDVDWTGTAETGSVKMTDINEKVAAQGTAAALKEIEQAFASNALQVFDTSTFTVNGETITEYMADVDSDPEFAPDTNVISDGYFHESEFRSAPYFDLNIDGITLLDN